MGWFKTFSLILVLTGVLSWGTVRGALARLDDDSRIVPGERIGPYRLGAAYAVFIEAWGENDLGAGRERQHCPGQKFAWTVKPTGFNAEFWKDRAVWVGVFSSAHLNYPERDALASKYRTDKGVRLSSSLADVRRAYGTPHQEGRVIGTTFWHYKTGLRLLLRRVEGEEKAIQIDVVPPGTILTEHALLPCPPVPDR
jgi:hypothetical protein